ncbi:MAG: CHRD domain-containing protein, partial [Saprospiraceae bacterium]
STPITIDFLNRMLAGGVYINVHTAANPGGEIRGQVYKLAREPYVFDMNGGQEVPPNSSTATGAGFVTIDRGQTNAHFMIVFNGLGSDFTSSHFHHGVPGVNGPVIFNLTNDFNDFGGAYGYWDHEDATPFNASPLFRENEIYVNVHSMGIPGGEVRGNVIRARDLFTEVPFNPGFGNNLMLLAQMDGSQEVPALENAAVGVGTVYFNEDRTRAFVNVTVDGLSGSITGAHIHDGAFGVNGPVMFPLTIVGNRIQTEISQITPEELGKLLGGLAYINVHTTANPGGEIRGQLFLEQDLTFVSLILGDSEVEPVVTDARGLGAFHYTIGTLSLDVNIQLTELSSDIRGAHLHRAAFGENGPVVIGLDSLRDGNRYQGRVNLTFEDYAALLKGNLYINIHTDTNPGGEIRGQLFYADGLVFDGWMSGLQEVPFATTAASGLSIALMSNDLSEIDVIMVTDGVSGNIGQAHLHLAAQGSNGPVIQDLTPSLNDNDIINFFTTPTTQLIDAFLSGNIYINAHTPAFPGGELRGQMYRLARDGYGFDMCPQQETNPINAPLAQGSGAVSIDRLHENFNVAFATTGLTGPVSGSHFHRGELGVAGPVVFNFTPFLQNGSLFGYGVTTTDTSLIPSILDGDIYVNIHTDAHPGGEIRGQVVKESLCTIETGAEELAHIVNDVLLSPVPVFESLTVAIDIHTNASLSMNVLDLSGKLISSDQYQLTEGENTVEINTVNLHSGFYILMISDGHAAQAYKFVK